VDFGRKQIGEEKKVKREEWSGDRGTGLSTGAEPWGRGKLPTEAGRKKSRTRNDQVTRRPSPSGGEAVVLSPIDGIPKQNKLHTPDRHAKTNRRKKTSSVTKTHPETQSAHENREDAASAVLQRGRGEGQKLQEERKGTKHPQPPTRRYPRALGGKINLTCKWPRTETGCGRGGKKK